MVDHETLLVSYQPPSRRAARAPQEGPALGGARRLHRLQGLRRGLPDRHRHPRRLAARVHPVRAVHRCLQRHHGQGRPAARPDRLRHHRRAGGGRQGRHGAAAARARAHAALRRPDLPGRRHHAGGAAQPHHARDQRAARPQSALRAAVRRRRAQRLHGQDPQQAARAARVRARACAGCRGAQARHRRHGARRAKIRVDHRRPARAARARDRAAGASSRGWSEARTPFALVVRDVASGHETARTTHFQKPAADAGRSP